MTARQLAWLLLFGALMPSRAMPMPARTVAASASSTPMTVELDATEAPRKVLHAKITIPARPGPLTLWYPKWIPGLHTPSGPIDGLMGLRLSAAGKPLAWSRDPVELYAFHCDVPTGADRVEVSLDYGSPAGPGERFGSWPNTTDHLAVIEWNEVLLYPGEVPADSIRCRASVRLPDGWKFGTALRPRTRDNRRVEFQDVSLPTLVDSPLLAGAYFRAIPLAPEITPSHELDLAADSPEALAIGPDRLRAHERLVREAAALFGTMHYAHYNFLVALSDGLSYSGLEHHESSDNHMVERGLVDDDKWVRNLDLLAHEFAHSWNGKHRRPAGLADANFDVPEKTELLWVYEGLTTYLGWVLAARAGIMTPEQAHGYLAVLAADQDHRAGRSWRPLLDTAVGAPGLFGAPRAWTSWRRGADFYQEGLLLWLDVDGIIRSETGGRRSLDDFCRLFHGGTGGVASVRPYTFDDVVETLNEVAPYDWRGYFIRHLTATAGGAPLDGIQKSGWRLEYANTMSEYERAIRRARETVDLTYSLGFSLDKEGVMIDVIEGSPAERAGIAPGMKLLAVNGRRWTEDVLGDALRAAARNRKEIELLVANGDFYRTRRVRYTDGPRYPHLVRELGREDRLTKLLSPLAARDQAETPVQAPGGTDAHCP